MADILHEIAIQASPERVFGSLTEAEGLRGWFTDDVEAESRIGGTVLFGFMNRSTVFRMEITELGSPRRLLWKCVGGPEEWGGTELMWELTAAHEGDASLHLSHTGWRSVAGDYPLCITTWGRLMYILKEYAEGMDPGPLFRGD